jgi:transcriptional regulator
MLTGIVAFELDVTRLECKIKVNQHRPEAQAKMLEIYSQGNPQEQSLARWIYAMNTSK